MIGNSIYAFFSFTLLGCLIFWSIHNIGYFDHVLKSVFLYPKMISKISSIAIQRHPKVAIFILVFNENPKLVERILESVKKICYENFSVFLLDDSSNPHILIENKRLTEKLGIFHIHRDFRRNYKVGAINDAMSFLERDFEYLLLLDVDHCPTPHIFDQTLTILENDPTLAFIQIPRCYPKKNQSPICLGYSLQMHIFHKHVCRGLHVNNSALMCGTNVIIRLKALRTIGGMSEKYLVEDLATSLKFHSAGYSSLYLDDSGIYGIAPSSFHAYFIQQLRWAYGTTAHIGQILSLLIHHPTKLKSQQWWEYLIMNGTWYFSGWILLFLLIYPMVVLLFKIPILFFNSLSLYFILLVVISSLMIILSVYERKYRLRDILFSQGLFMSIFLVYILASVNALRRKDEEFNVTPKLRYEKTSLVLFFPHIIIYFSLIISFIMGTAKLINHTLSDDYFSFLFWILFNIIVFSIMFYMLYRERVYYGEPQGWIK